MIFNKKKKKLLQADKALSFSFYNNIYIKFNSFDSNKKKIYTRSKSKIHRQILSKIDFFTFFYKFNF